MIFMMDLFFMYGKWDPPVLILKNKHDQNEPRIELDNGVNIVVKYAVYCWICLIDPNQWTLVHYSLNKI